MNPVIRCLAHGCARPDTCRHHLIIRQTQSKDGDTVTENACAEGLAGLSFNEADVRRSALEAS
jgi:hypothetical protein